jgi:hypothetical protein
LFFQPCFSENLLFSHDFPTMVQAQQARVLADEKEKRREEAAGEVDIEMVGDPSAHVGEVHGDHWGAPALAVTVAVGSGGTVSTAVVQAEGRFRRAGEASDGRPQMSRASYEDVKQARWEAAREAGLAGRLPPARIWSSKGAFALKTAVHPEP